MLSIDKELSSNDDADSSGDVSVGDTLKYKITARNTGTANLTNVVITDDLTNANTEDSADANCDDPLLPDTTCVLTTTYVVEQGDVDAGEIRNTGVADE
jgi:uncharacterized repeat protein (TIGR01451 family)